jgi:hypothetical protein
MSDTIFTSRELRERVKGCGSHFFDRDTMSFFASRLAKGIYPGGDDITYFVTSEKMGFDDDRRQ